MMFATLLTGVSNLTVGAAAGNRCGDLQLALLSDGPLLFGFPADYSDCESPMIGMSRSPIVTGVVLGVLFLYFAYGAVVVGDLVFYVRNGPNVHLHGLAAWLVTLSPVLISAGLSVRGGLIEFSSDKARKATELALMIGGGALFVLVLALQRGSL